MKTCPPLASVLAVIFQLHDKTIFIIEAVGIFTFATYWWIKSREISTTNADHKALDGELTI